MINFGTHILTNKSLHIFFNLQDHQKPIVPQYAATISLFEFYKNLILYFW